MSERRVHIRSPISDVFHGFLGILSGDLRTDERFLVSEVFLRLLSVSQTPDVFYFQISGIP